MTHMDVKIFPTILAVNFLAKQNYFSFNNLFYILFQNLTFVGEKDLVIFPKLTYIYRIFDY